MMTKQTFLNGKESQKTKHKKIFFFYYIDVQHFYCEKLLNNVVKLLRICLIVCQKMGWIIYLNALSQTNHIVKHLLCVLRKPNHSELNQRNTSEHKANSFNSVRHHRSWTIKRILSSFRYYYIKKNVTKLILELPTKTKK